MKMKKNLENLTKKELIEKINELEGKTKQIEPKKDTIKIRNRYTNRVIFESKTAETIKEAVEEAVKSKANLWGANLSKANLSGANLSNADLSYADLSYADLSNADLSYADFSKADLWKADLCFCKMDKKVFKEITEGWFEWEVKE